MSGSHDGHGGEGASPESVASGFEISDWQMKPVIFMLITVFASLALAYVGITALVSLSGRELADTSHTLRTVDPAQLPDGPLLEQNPEVEGTQMIATANAQLTSYGWVDRRAGVVHIPRDRAKDLLLELGVSPFATPVPAEAAPAEGTTP